MKNSCNTKEKKAYKIWVISEGSPVKIDLSNITKEPVSGSVREYSISALARYLLNPGKIHLHEKIVGCRVQYRKPRTGIIRRVLNIIKRSDDQKDDNSLTEEIISDSRIGTPAFKDENLNAHVIRIWEMLMPYDPVRKRLAKLDRENIQDITAICEEIGGHRYSLNLQGNINEKMDFVSNSLSKKTKVIFNRAYLSNGLFEMRAFDPGVLKTNKSYRLIKFKQGQEEKCCVLNADYKFEFWVDDSTLIEYLFILEQALKADPRLREAFLLCAKRGAMALKLFFAEQLERGYSEVRLPGLYRKLLSAVNLDPREKGEIVNMLNSNQGVVFFNYLPRTEEARQKIVTNITVMHNLTALEPIKAKLPDVYLEIDKKASVSEAGKLYLLDSIREHQDV